MAKSFLSTLHLPHDAGDAIEAIRDAALSDLAGATDGGSDHASPFALLVDALVQHPVSALPVAVAEDGADRASSHLFLADNPAAGLHVEATAGYLATAHGDGGFTFDARPDGSWELHFTGGDDRIGYGGSQGWMAHDPLNQPPGAPPADGRDVITGTSASELLNGTAGHETILAGDGNDTISGGIGDYMDGGSGRNCAAYSGTGAVLVDLEHGHGYGGNAEGDAFVNIQQTKGSDVADVLIASHTGSDLKGGGGNDLLIGGAGNDELRGDGGSDVLFGGGGADRVFFDPTHGWDGKTDVMLDFHAQQGDWLDLSSIVHGFNGNIDNYVKLVDQADGTHVFFNADGQVATSSIELIDLKFAHGLSAQQLYLDHNIIV